MPPMPQGGAEDHFAGEFTDEAEAAFGFRRQKRWIYCFEKGGKGRVRETVELLGKLSGTRMTKGEAVICFDPGRTAEY